METSASPSRRYTLEEYASLQEPDGVVSDLVRGLLVREPRPGSLHGLVQVEVASRLHQWARGHGGGWVFAESGVILQRRSE
ncbi:MAG: Uma2 family endonuclease, partial [Gemmatimonadetes bacterium]|nr:Uma2 family endonuclease [Gemmatimonadota bacterium]